MHILLHCVGVDEAKLMKLLAEATDGTCSLFFLKCIMAALFFRNRSRSKGWSTSKMGKGSRLFILLHNAWLNFLFHVQVDVICVCHYIEFDMT